MTKYITVKLTDGQRELLLGVLQTAIWEDSNPQTQAFKQRTFNKLAKAKTV